jgi:hypothetical protein
MRFKAEIIISSLVVLCLGLLIARTELSRRHRAAEKRSMASIRELTTVIDAYLDTGSELPQLNPGDVSRLVPSIQALGGYRLEDGWDNQIQIETMPRWYLLWSRGSDGQTEVAPGAGYTSTNSDDIISVNGYFWRYPDGGGGDPPDPSEYLSYGELKQNRYPTPPHRALSPEK